METPAALSVAIGGDSLQAQTKLQLDEVLGVVPGVYTQDLYNFAQNLRISIRGFGARGLQLQVLRGPASVQYGNGAGGVFAP